MECLSVVSLNVRGLNNYEKRVKIYDWLKDTDIHIAFLQETHYIEKKEVIYDSRWHGKSVHSFSNSTHSRGVSILFNNIDISIVNHHKTQDGRILLVNIIFREIDYTLITVYCPNTESEKISFFKKLKTYVSKYALTEENIILAGDFNCVFQAIDRLNNQCHLDKSVPILRDLLLKFSLNDTWRKINWKKPGFTWCNADNTPVSRIDYIFISDLILSKVEKINVKQVPGTHSDGIRLSDHRAINIKIDINENKRGPGYWKLNTSLLKNEEYKKNIKALIKTYQKIHENKTEILNTHETWERLKLDIKNYSIQFSKSLRKSHKQKLKELENKIQEIEEKPFNEINMREKISFENELNQLIDNKCKGAQIRSRVKWLEEGEKNTSYFLRLENQQQSYNVIRKLAQDEHTLSNDSDILNELCLFYENLYKSKQTEENNTGIQDYIKQTELKSRLTENEKTYCDEFPTINECVEAIMNMKDNKSPGLDGLPNEFYKTFCDDLKHLYHATLIETFEKNIMPFSQRLSVLSLLHKKGPRDKIKNYRPISLTNSDYKILAFLLAKRLQKIIGHLIDGDQTAYIKGRFIGFSARTVLDIFEYCENSNDPHILLFCDFEKAFDSVEWNFLFKTLKHMNFGDNFLKWVKILYTNPVFRIKNNNWISRTCSMTRGIRQGCPISALLFIFVAEVLAEKIRSNENIKGFKTSEMEKEINIIQHADDCTLPVKDKDSLKEAIITIENFSKHSGLILNTNKTECLLLGSLKDTATEILGLKVNDECIKSLGIYIGHNKKECFKQNWLKRYKDMEKLFESWKKRKHTIFGKVCVINSLAISKLVYTATLLPVPDESFLKDINKLIFNFIWNKRDRIKRNTLIGNTLDGGLHVVDLESKFKALKASWVPKIVSCNHRLKDFLAGFCKRNNVDLIYLLNTNCSFLKENVLLHKYVPYFYREVITYFNECKDTKCKKNIFSQNIWRNCLFSYKKDTLCFMNWIKSGILHVKDLFTENGFKDIQEFDLKCKVNWLCEYKIMRFVFKNVNVHYKERHMNNVNLQFLFKNGSFELIKEKSCKFFNDIFVHQKFKRPNMEKIWEKEFDLVKPVAWNMIYKNNIRNIVDKNVAEFKYKLIHNLLCNRYMLSKWKPDVNNKCSFCGNIVENTKHLIFDCPNVANIWSAAESVLKTKIQWKHVVLGFFYESNTKVRNFNFILAYIACRIYKTKMFFRIKNKPEMPNDLSMKIKLDCQKVYLTIRKSYYSYINDDLLKTLYMLL